jgi:undecaprenyl phosphate N,N'-diacetylbacillosamine 1-phosphate transferase
MRPYLIVKRSLDFVFAVILLIVLSPLMLLVAIAIKLDSRGPVFFKQERPGKGARIFTIYKFRTMSVETEKAGKPLSNIARMTKVGSFLRKTSIDELPQLFNILKGEMSFIGPRPLLVEYLEYYSSEQKRRHEVKPGISGWAQVNGRNAISWEEKFKYDIWYVNNQSLLLDIKILFLTVYNVLRRKGINNSLGDTMPFFRGNKEKTM